MSNEQFIHWLLGFCAAIEDIPTQKQWEHIKKVLGDMNCKSVVSIDISNNNNYNSIFKEIVEKNPPTKYQWPEKQPPIMLYQNYNTDNDTF